MAIEAKQHLDRVLQTSEFKFGDFFSAGFDLWKKGFWPLLGFILLYAIALSVISVIPYLGWVLTNLVLAPILTGGAYVYCRNLRRDGIAEFESFFSLYNSPTNLLIAYFLYYLIIVLSLIPFMLSIGFDVVGVWGTPEMVNYFEDFDFSNFMLLIPIFFLLLLFAYVVPFVVFYKLSPVDALTYSFKFCGKHYISILLFSIAVIFVVMLGMIALFIGIFFTMTMIYPMTFESFRLLTDLDGFEKQDQQQVVINQLIE